jgi:hypothetical protein
MRPLLLVVGGLLLAGCAGGDGSPRAAAPERAGSAGVTVELPTGWHAAEAADLAPGQVVDPLARVVVSSAPVARRASGCQVADHAPPAGGVSLVVFEWQEPEGDWPARPARFTRQTLEIHPPPVIECFDGSGGSVEFRDRGRTFGAYLMLGRAADPALADQALAVLDTLRVEPRDA